MTIQTITQTPPFEPASIPVVEGWVGNWRISLRRRGYSREELSDIYAVKAGHWDEDLSTMGVQNAYRRIHAALDLPFHATRTTPKRVLDCGIGTGAFSTALLKSTPGYIDLHGVDISPEMLDRARSCLKKCGVEPVLTVGDARRLPYQDNHFDLVMSAHMLEHLAEPKAALAEMTRVLKPGGHLLLCVTKNSLLGRHIQLKWRTHAIDSQTATRWLSESGLEDISFPTPNGHPLFNTRSLICLARKSWA